MTGKCIRCGERQTFDDEVMGLVCPQCRKLVKHISMEQGGATQSGEVQLRTAGNISHNELIFDVTTTSDCGGIVGGIKCRFANSKYSFVIDADHLQHILDIWQRNT